MNRIPLWIDARGAADPDACIAAAKDVGSEVILGGDARLQGDRIIHQDVDIGQWIRLEGPADQERAATAPGIVVIEGQDWTIIPLENLIAARRDRPGTLFAVAHDAEQAGVFRDTLEIGVHGVVLRTHDAHEVRRAHDVLVAKGPRPDDAEGDAEGIRLVAANVVRIEDAGPGDRVCVDTTSTFGPGEGLLVGSTARGYALIHAETIASQYVNPRPFRVNAGAIHCYHLAPGGKTGYLSELRAGHRVLGVSPDGTSRELTVGRAKIERRPHTRVVWDHPDGEGQVIVQNAETIRFVRPDGTPVAVTDLAAGDEILVHHERSARHFGMAVEERLVER